MAECASEIVRHAHRPLTSSRQNPMNECAAVKGERESTEAFISPFRSTNRTHSSNNSIGLLALLLYKPTMGFDTKLFVQQPVDTHITCAICYDVLEKPTTVCCNGHTFCAGCIATWGLLPNGKECPDCRQVMATTKLLNRPLQSIIMGSTIQCPAGRQAEGSRTAVVTPGASTAATTAATTVTAVSNGSNKRVKLSSTNTTPTTSTATTNVPDSGYGCPWQGSLASYLDKHAVSECAVATKTCTFCDNDIVVASLARHREKECPKRLVGCPLCKQKVVANILAFHQSSVCPNKALKCPNCRDIVLRKDLGKYKTDLAALQKRTYTGHMKVCKKASCVKNEMRRQVLLRLYTKTYYFFSLPFLLQLHVPCEFALWGCPCVVRRDQMKAHKQAQVDFHSGLLNTQIKKLVDQSEWQPELAVEWNVPWTKIKEELAKEEIVDWKSERIRRHGLESWMEVTMNEFEDVMNFYICLDEAGSEKHPPQIGKIEFSVVVGTKAKYQKCWAEPQDMRRGENEYYYNVLGNDSFPGVSDCLEWSGDAVAAPAITFHVKYCFKYANKVVLKDFISASPGNDSEVEDV